MDIGGICRYGQVEKLTPEALEHISGDSEADIPLWSLQSEPNSCAVDCASSVLRGEVDETITEAELIQAGRELGLYQDDGTYFSDVRSEHRHAIHRGADGLQRSLIPMGIR